MLVAVYNTNYISIGILFEIVQLTTIIDHKIIMIIMYLM